MEAGLQRSVLLPRDGATHLQEEGVPTDLVWLAQVESGWNPYAYSWAAAKGIWQFIPSTAARFGPDTKPTGSTSVRILKSQRPLRLVI